MYSDASNSGIGTCFEIKGGNITSTKIFLAQKNVGVLHDEHWKQFVCSFLQFLNNNSLFWHPGNFAASEIVESGNNKPELQTKAVKIFVIFKVKNLKLEITWISP